MGDKPARYRVWGTYLPHGQTRSRTFAVTEAGADVELPSGEMVILYPASAPRNKTATGESVEYHANPANGWVLRISGKDGHGNPFSLAVYANGDLEITGAVLCHICAETVYERDEPEDAPEPGSCAGCGCTHGHEPIMDDDELVPVSVHPLIARGLAYRQPHGPLLN